MNIFILDSDIERCAQAHCDQHVVKMTLESGQILCSALHLHGIDAPYRPTHLGHPCVLWAAQSYDNFCWLRSLMVALNAEYRYRYRKPNDHRSMRVLAQIEGLAFQSCGLTSFAQAMPEQFKDPQNPVNAYRNYYRHHKLGFARWTRRPPPRWLKMC